MSRRHRFERGIDHRCQASGKTCLLLLTSLLRCPRAQTITPVHWSTASSYIQCNPTCPFLIENLNKGYFGGMPTPPTHGPTQPLVREMKSGHWCTLLTWSSAVLYGTKSSEAGLANIWALSTQPTVKLDSIIAAYNRLPPGQSVDFALWHYGYIRWIECNDEESIDGRTAEERQQKQRLEIDHLVCTLHINDKHRVREVDQHLFTMSLPHKQLQA